MRQQGAAFARVIAFEPDPLNWPRLQATVAALPDEIRAKVTCYPKAVSAASGGFKVGASHIYKMQNATHTVTVTIKDKGGSSASATLTVTIKLPTHRHHTVVHGSARLTGRNHAGRTVSGKTAPLSR